MPESQVRLSGRILHLFAHRFVVQTARGAILADVTPHGLEQMALHVGDEVTLEGEQKPSEIKVGRLTRDGRMVLIDHKKKRHGPHDELPADPEIALGAARAAGYEPLGAPRRKPKHFEVLGRRGGVLTELHIELDGSIRKTKPALSDDPKWREGTID
jgi:hypothetical protein